MLKNILNILIGNLIGMESLGEKLRKKIHKFAENNKEERKKE